jgi:hypothetical protein
VEGGGDHNKPLGTQCSKGFRTFLQKAGLAGFEIVKGGSRSQAYKKFCTAHESAGRNEIAILLVDSEAPVTQVNPWEHVRLRVGDRWQCPSGASQAQLHFMVQAMEAWFHADPDALEKYYVRDFQSSKLSQRRDIENIPKADLYSGLQKATKNCQKGEYSKGDHSFAILALIDPTKVSAASPHAKQLLDTLAKLCATELPAS